MPSVELSKLQGIAATRPVTTSERAQIESRAAPPRSPGAPHAGVSVEVDASLDTTTAPIDAERIAQIRAALEDGSYPLVPAKIVDALIAAQISFSVPAKE